MLRILDLPEPLFPISKTLRFFVFLISADKPAAGVLWFVDADAISAGVSISEGGAQRLPVEAGGSARRNT